MDAEKGSSESDVRACDFLRISGYVNRTGYDVLVVWQLVDCKVYSEVSLKTKPTIQMKP